MALTYEPIATVEPPECVAQPSSQRASCPTCGKTFAGGSIVTDPAILEDDGFTVVRRMYCDHCDQVIAWKEMANAQGLPTSVVVSGPGIVRARRSVTRFLSRYPQAAGVTP